MKFDWFDFSLVDGNWTEWSPWGSCDRSCGLGKLIRQRWCAEPVPENGGFQCDGDAFESQQCNDFPCDGMFFP